MNLVWMMLWRAEWRASSQRRHAAPLIAVLLACMVTSAGTATAAAPSAAPSAAPMPAAAAPARRATGTFYDGLNPNRLGGLLGAGVGVMGGIIGAVGGACAPRGRAKGLVVTLFGIMIVGGLVLMGLGIGALVVEAPGMLAYAFLMPGGLAALLGIILFPVMLTRYRQAELRRLEAESFRAS